MSTSTSSLRRKPNAALAAAGRKRKQVAFSEVAPQPDRYNNSESDDNDNGAGFYDDEGDYYANDEERRQEMELDQRHGGGAADDIRRPKPKNKTSLSSSSEQDIAKTLRRHAKEGNANANPSAAGGGGGGEGDPDDMPAQKKRKPPPAPLSTIQLLGDNGLTLLMHQGKALMNKYTSTTVSKDNQPKLQVRGKEPHLARQLVNLMNAWARDLYPRYNVEDTFRKVHDQLGSKKEVKDYLQIQRDLSLESTLQSTLSPELKERVWADRQRMMSNSTTTATLQGAPNVNDENVHADDDEDYEEANTGSGQNVVSPPRGTTLAADSTEADKPTRNAITGQPVVTPAPARRPMLSRPEMDDDSEEEANLDDVMPASSIRRKDSNANRKEQNMNTAKSHTDNNNEDKDEEDDDEMEADFDDVGPALSANEGSMDDTTEDKQGERERRDDDGETEDVDMNTNEDSQESTTLNTTTNKEKTIMTTWETLAAARKASNISPSKKNATESTIHITINGNTNTNSTSPKAMTASVSLSTPPKLLLNHAETQPCISPILTPSKRLSSPPSGKEPPGTLSLDKDDTEAKAMPSDVKEEAETAQQGKNHATVTDGESAALLMNTDTDVGMDVETPTQITETTPSQPTEQIETSPTQIIVATQEEGEDSTSQVSTATSETMDIDITIGTIDEKEAPEINAAENPAMEQMIDTATQVLATEATAENVQIETPTQIMATQQAETPTQIMATQQASPSEALPAEEKAETPTQIMATQQVTTENSAAFLQEETATQVYDHTEETPTQVLLSTEETTTQVYHMAETSTQVLLSTEETPTQVLTPAKHGNSGTNDDLGTPGSFYDTQQQQLTEGSREGGNPVNEESLIEELADGFSQESDANGGFFTQE
jgi:hypothetical protein